MLSKLYCTNQVVQQEMEPCILFKVTTGAIYCKIHKYNQNDWLMVSKQTTIRARLVTANVSRLRSDQSNLIRNTDLNNYG